MNYKIIDKIPTNRKRLCWHNLKDLLKEFLSIESPCIEIDPVKEGYKNVKSFQTAIADAIRKYGYREKIRTASFDEKVYLIKCDISEDEK